MARSLVCFSSIDFFQIHEFMTGRIKLLKNGTLLNEDNMPTIGYDYDRPGSFDGVCGTFNLDGFQLPHDPTCPDRFVCDTDKESEELQVFASCIDAMNCHMLRGMTTNVASGSEKVLFMHQMIPHHENAVNMAKALLNTGSLSCDDVTLETDDCVLMVMMYEIINGQNFQIQTMRKILQGNDTYLETDYCVVPFPNDVPSTTSASLDSAVGWVAIAFLPVVLLRWTT
jgi:hypothetical protein